MVSSYFAAPSSTNPLIEANRYRCHESTIPTTTTLNTYALTSAIFEEARRTYQGNSRWSNRWPGFTFASCKPRGILLPQAEDFTPYGPISTPGTNSRGAAHVYHAKGGAWLIAGFPWTWTSARRYPFSRITIFSILVADTWVTKLEAQVEKYNFRFRGRVKR